MTLRRLLMGLATVTGWRRQGWFIPYRYAESLPGPGDRLPYPALEALFRSREGAFATVLTAIERHGDDLRAIGAARPPQPRWGQDWFPRLDAAAAYGMVRERKPRRIVEVGSGHSTRFMARAIADGGLDCRLTAIDPVPRADLAGLDIDLIRRTLHQAGDEPFAALRAGDVLFIDSSHILMPGSDVDALFGRVLPALPTGVLVHVHDIFLPDDYPVDWAWRGYNEQLALVALLQGGAFAVDFASHYVATRMKGHLAGGVLAELPLPAGAHESSLWLTKVG